MSEKRITVGQMMEELAQRREEDTTPEPTLAEMGAKVYASLDLSAVSDNTTTELAKLYLMEKEKKEGQEEMSEKEETIHRMRSRIADADRMICDIERLARRKGIKVTVHFGAELANCHDALAELEEQVRNL